MTPIAQASPEKRRVRDWLPFCIVALGIVALAGVTPVCRCMDGRQHTRIIRALLLVPIGLLAIRHLWAFVKKERGFPWAAYLLLAMAIPFLAALFELIAGDSAASP